MHGTVSVSNPIEPAILYFGTPVVLIGTTNEDGSFNLAPMSSKPAWWVGWRCMLGLARNSKTTENMIRSGECVLNLTLAPSLVDAVPDQLSARTTGSNPVPPGKIRRGYRHEKDKFGLCGLTATPGDTVAAPRAVECPVQIEAKVAHVHEMAQEDMVWRSKLTAIEVRVTRVHAHPDIMMEGETNRIDPDKWRPLIMSFQQFSPAPDKRQPKRKDSRERSTSPRAGGRPSGRSAPAMRTDRPISRRCPRRGGSAGAACWGLRAIRKPQQT